MSTGEIDYVAEYERLKKVNQHLAQMLHDAYDNLIWCGGSGDFAPGGMARVGWVAGPQKSIEEISAWYARHDHCGAGAGGREMTNPPSFVMYVVMVKPTKDSKFDPCWGEWADSLHGVYARGFARKRDADKECRIFRTRYGKKNAYVQQYGPYS